MPNGLSSCHNPSEIPSSAHFVELYAAKNGNVIFPHETHQKLGCTKCHGEDLSGKMLSDDPFIGTIPAANLTSGKGGVGASYRDADWIRAIRYGIEPDGHATIFMNNYAALSDQDLGDLIAYLKQISPVDAKYPANRYGPLSALPPAVGPYTPAAKMTDQSMPRPAAPAPGAGSGA